jgi:branched-chain amino acid transport system substrate-binding protein
MSPILSVANLAAISPSSTNPDINDPKFAREYRPNGKAIYFRMVPTDAYQAPNMANYMRDTLHIGSVFVLDDSSAVGIGQADAYEQQAHKIGLRVLGHDHLNPLAADYTASLTKIRALSADAIYFGGPSLAGIKLAKQAYDVIPSVVKAGSDGMFNAELLRGAGFPAVEGWYATLAGPHLVNEPALKDWVARFRKFSQGQPSDYAITAYDAGEVIIDAIRRVANSGKAVNRDTVRDAIQATNLQTLQGQVSFDPNGDISSKVVSVFRIEHDPNYPSDDLLHQYKYVGAALALPKS